MKLILSDVHPDALAAWRMQFLKRPEVEIRAEPVFDTAAGAFLLPGNSFGFLDSGMALAACERFGWDLQESIRERIRTEHSGELLVGQAVLVRAPALDRYVVYAPLWRTPRKLDNTVNVFLAVRGAFLELERRREIAISSLAIAALGVEDGGLDARVSARQIRYAYEIASGQRGRGDKNLSQQIRRERKLVSIPGLDKDDPPEAGSSPLVNPNFTLPST